MSGSRQGFSGSADRMALFPGLIISKMAADGHLGMMALSRVILAPAGLSCCYNWTIFPPTNRLSTMACLKLLTD